jgi:hypothetical protein
MSDSTALDWALILPGRSCTRIDVGPTDRGEEKAAEENQGQPPIAWWFVDIIEKYIFILMMLLRL